jgi:hypothetical protein
MTIKSKKHKPKKRVDSKIKVKVVTTNLLIENVNASATTQELLKTQQNNASNIFFEQLAGQEIINIARHDSINSENILYTPISDLSNIYKKYNPNNILGLQDSSSNYFAKFTLSLYQYIPNYGSGTGGSTTYIDSSANLVLNFVNIFDHEYVEIQFIIPDSISDTIYT